MSATFQWEPLETILAEPNFRDLFTEWWEEMSPYKGTQVVDWAALVAENRTGFMPIWTARVDGTLAGWVRFYVLRPPETSNILVAHDRGYYLAPRFRDKERLAWRMFRSARAALKEMGVKHILWHDNAKRPLMGFFLAMGAVPIGTLYREVLK